MARPRKRFAQHWLRNEAVVRRIVQAAHLTAGDPATPQSGDRVLEIGPGKGVLTQHLLAQAAAVVAVEIDTDLCQALAKKWGDHDNFLLLQGDFLELHLEALLAPFPHLQQPNKVVANIPYNITGPILETLLGTIEHPAPHPYDRIVLMVQQEVAQRLYAKPGKKQFGALSVRVQYRADCELVCPVPARYFYPPPKVDSAVVALTPRPFPVTAHDPHHLATLVKLGFASKRKMLRNNLQSLVDRDRLLAAFDRLGIDPQVRAEAVSVAQWVHLSNDLNQSVPPAST